MMGQSTNAILFYGITFEDLDTEALAKQHGLEEFDAEDAYAAKVGIERPSVPYSESEKGAWVDYWRRKQDASPCEMDWHCSSEYPIYLACIKESKRVSLRGDETEIPDGLTAKPEWVDQLRAYCDVMGLPYSQPRWLLVSYWG